MSKDVVCSKKDKASTHDFMEYVFAKAVVMDFPKLIAMYEKILPTLYPYGKYTGAWSVIQAVEDAKLLLSLQHDYYKKVYAEKGKIQGRD